jgi:hypothetical protein
LVLGSALRFRFGFHSVALGSFSVVYEIVVLYYVIKILMLGVNAYSAKLLVFIHMELISGRATDG